MARHVCAGAARVSLTPSLRDAADPSSQRHDTSPALAAYLVAWRATAAAQGGALAPPAGGVEAVWRPMKIVKAPEQPPAVGCASGEPRAAVATPPASSLSDTDEAAGQHGGSSGALALRGRRHAAACDRTWRQRSKHGANVTPRSFQPW
mmetsp:Transcript_32834/g.95911  ORF Transcript_32834/g.95911 Transcript_32834/m.95911 type:complete len:149 (+) Transcript_32834:520-966(+)